jgi:glutathione S-transferase
MQTGDIRIWLVGNEFSIADIAIATHFVSLRQIGYEVDPSKWPHLSKYLNKVFSRNSFRKHMNL